MLFSYQNWIDKPLTDYSTALWEKLTPIDSFDPTLRFTLQQYFQQQDVPAALQQAFFNRPFFQTAHHLTPSLGPTFLGIDLLMLAAKPASAPYFVAGYSALPMNNNAWSGSLCFQEQPLEKVANPVAKSFTTKKKGIKIAFQQGAKEKKVHLIPPKEQSAMLFRFPVSLKLLNNFAELTETLQAKLPHPSNYSDYAQWVCATCQLINRQVLLNDQIFYFNINEIALNHLVYLLETQQEFHPLYALLIDKKFQQSLSEAVQQETLFVQAKPGLKKTLLEKIVLYQLPKTWHNNPKQALFDIKNLGFVPSLFWVFSLLCSWSAIRVGGSFHQHAYLQKYQNLWCMIKNQYQKRFGNNDYTKLATANPTNFFNLFTYARIPQTSPRYALDCFIANQPLPIDWLKKLPMSVFWEEKHAFMQTNFPS